MDGDKGLEDDRQKTDASLTAERASIASESREQARQRFADRIEHDRLLVDEKLLAFRERANERLAADRRAEPSPDSSVMRERAAADDATHDEREMADAMLEQERQRSDDSTKRADRVASARQKRRADTDESLAAERLGVDEALTAGAETARSLPEARAHDILAMVAHELNNPLTSITLNAHMFAEHATDAEGRQAAEDVLHSAARMKRIVADLMDGARIDAGTLRVSPKRQDVGFLLREIRDSYAPLFAHRSLTFTVVEPTPTTSLVALFDRDRIVQVISNLLSNAMKFTPRTGTVTVHAEHVGDHAEIVVRNTGPGIPASALPHVFERFWQAGNESRVGLGLGLFICKNIVAAHGGRIVVESGHEEGATFRFTLPVANRAA